ncbi:hypothetical protein [Burkholderia cepacia]|uniref:hypothetical protein n=1 Tax=Burkholderia cepacia TaxID=292 RepID=UPI0012D86B2A|nr:hypothetical protein [Burkholderia cepacia]
MSTSPKKKPDPEFVKLKPTMFPLGFAISQVSDGMLILDFIDVINGKSTVIESVALTAGKAAQLSSALVEALENGKSEE